MDDMIYRKSDQVVTPIAATLPDVGSLLDTQA